MSKRILVVDDSNLMRHRISQCLEDAGHKVVGKAKDGEESIVLYRETRPDVVIMDITMRGKDGITAAQEILSFDPEASIIFYTLLDTSIKLAERLDKIAVKKLIRKGDEDGLLRTLAQRA